MINSLAEHWKLWVAGASAAIYVFRNAKEHPFSTRMIQVAVSTGMGASQFESAALAVNAPPEVMIFGIIVLGYAFLDIITKIGRDPEFWKEIIRNRLQK